MRSDATAALAVALVVMVLGALAAVFLYQRAEKHRTAAIQMERVARTEAQRARAMAESVRNDLATPATSGPAQPVNLEALYAGVSSLAEHQRIQSLVGISRQGSDRTIEILADALGDPSPVVRSLAAILLGTLESAAAPAVPALSQALADAAVRDEAFFALRRIGAEAAVAVPVLVGELSAADPRRRKGAASVLGAMGRAGGASIPALEVLRDDPDQSVRRTAAAALRSIRGEGE